MFADGSAAMRWSCMRTILVASTVLASLATIAHACNVPIFRYALERWPADAYRLTVFHLGPLDPATEQVVASLEAYQSKRKANIEVRRVDIERLRAAAEVPIEGEEIIQAADRGLLASQDGAALPHFFLQYPRSLKFDTPLASSPLSETIVKSWLESPARTELIRRLSTGQAAVWLLLESGDYSQDTAAAELLAAESERLASELTLPILTDSTSDMLLSNVPLKLEFSVLRIRRDDPVEREWVKILLHSDPVLAELREPIVFPVFGRGRVLLGLVGEEIKADNLRGSAEFLIGACSCEVKELNPGLDLLLSHDWDSLLSPLAAERIKAMLSATTSEPGLIPIPPGSASVRVTSHPTDTLSDTANRPMPSIFVAVMIGGVIAGLAALVLASRRLVWRFIHRR